MFKRKNWLAALLALVMVLSLAACGGGNSGSGSSGGGDAQQPSGGAPRHTPPPDPPPRDHTQWEQSSGIYETGETDEELYQKALEEGATVTLYSISSRCTKVAEAFMEKYPGLECVPFDISTNDLLEKVTREYEAGSPTADVVHIKDQDGYYYCTDKNGILLHDALGDKCTEKH